MGLDGPSSLRLKNNFSGTFDGNGHVIANLYIDDTADLMNGLFAAVDGDGEVRNLGLEDVSVTCRTHCGALAAVNVGVIDICYSTGSIRATRLFDTISGGLVGNNRTDGVVRNSYSKVSVTVPSGGSQIGGLIGLSSGIVRNCFATGNIMGEASSSGGLVGANIFTGSVVNCYATGNVTAQGDDRGALVGMTKSRASVVNSYATGNVTGDGALVGNNLGTVTSSYWERDMDVAGDSDKTSDQLKSLPVADTADLFDGWSTDDWDFGDDTQYPAVKSKDDDASGTRIEGYVLCEQPDQDSDPALRADCYSMISVEGRDAVVEGGSPAVFAITRRGNVPDAAAVDVAVTLSFTEGFTTSSPTSTTVILPAGSWVEATLEVPVLENDVDSAVGMAMAVVSIPTVEGQRLASTHRSATVVITDNDPILVSIAGGDPVTEGDGAEFTVSRARAEAASLDVKFMVRDGENFITNLGYRVTVGDTDISENDENFFVVTIMSGASEVVFEVETQNDNKDELDGMFEATVQADLDGLYRVNATDSSVLTVSATVDILDNELSLVLIRKTEDAREGAGSLAVPAVFTVQRGVPDPDHPLDVRVMLAFSVGSLSLDGSSETTATVTINANETSATLAVGVMDNAIDQVNGWMRASFAPASTYRTLPNASAQATIIDDDLVAIVSFEIGDSSASVIDEAAKRITVAVPEGTNLTGVTPTVFTVRSNASVVPVGAQTFVPGRAVNYTVNAFIETATYQVTVEVGSDTPPGVPGGFSAQAQAGQVTLSWMEPTELGTTGTLSRYEYRRTQGLVVSSWVAVSPPTATTQVVGSLTAGEVYGFEVRAVGSGGLPGAPTAKIETRTLGGSSTLTFGSKTIANQNYTVNTPISPQILPEATGGTGTLTYALTPTLPGDLSFNVTTRTLTGTPGAVAAVAEYTYTATDASGNVATLTFMIRVNAQGSVVFDAGERDVVVGVYPNPSGDTLHVDLPAGEFKISVLTLTGQPVLGERQVGGGSRTLDLSSLTRGVYVLKVEDSEGVSQTFRILR